MPCLSGFELSVPLSLFSGDDAKKNEQDKIQGGEG